MTKKEKNKCIETMLSAFEFQCIALCRDRNGESNPYINSETAIFVCENNKYIMFKKDIETAQKIISYIYKND